MLKQCVFGVLMTAAALAVPSAAAQNRADNDARAKLAFFIGTWTVAGSEDSYRETCEWLTRESFVVCRAEDTNPKERDVSLSILGYSVEEQAYTYTSFSGSGDSRTLRAWLQGDQWVFTGGRQHAGKSVRWQVTIVPNTRGFHFRQDVSANGAPWATSFETQYLKLP